MHSIDKGSQIAKDGFNNEDDIIKKFNNWKVDIEAQKWLQIMEYQLDEIELVEAFKVSGFKTDVQVQVSIKLKSIIEVQNLQLKLVKNKKGFNQIDKRWIDKYVEMWSIPPEVTEILKHYSGELKPYIAKPKDSRRMFANEFSEHQQNLVLTWLENN